MTCPVCKNGQMIFNGKLYNCSPPKYYHQCDVCGYMEPYEEIKEKDGDKDDARL